MASVVNMDKRYCNMLILLDWNCLQNKRANMSPNPKGNFVLYQQINKLSERKSIFHPINKIIRDWRFWMIAAPAFITLKSIVESLIIMWKHTH